MKNIHAKNIQRIALFIAMLLGLNITTTLVFAQDADGSDKIQLLSEAIFARDTGDLYLAREKAELLVAMEPNDTNLQALLISINQAIEEESIYLEIEDDIVRSSTSSDSFTEDDSGYDINIAGGEVDDAEFAVLVNQEDAISISTEEDMLSPMAPENVSLDFLEQLDKVEELISIANYQISIGDLAGAKSTILEIEARNPNSKRAKALSIKLSEAIAEVQGVNLYKTRKDMLNSVEDSWDTPKVFELEEISAEPGIEIPSIQVKLNDIVLPKINFTGMALTRVIETLSELSVEYDSDGEGVNIIPIFDSSRLNPKVNITLRNLSLDRILKFVTQQVDFTYQVGEDAVTIQPSDSIGGTSSTITEFFPLSRATVIRITGIRDSGSSSNFDDPFSDEPSSMGQSKDQEKDALKKFLQDAGVNFDGVAGSSLAFDGEQLIVTQTPRNIERLRNILNNYNEVKQVEIETKFLEVAQNDLEELGFEWSMSEGGAVTEWLVQSNLRSLNDIGSALSSKTAKIIQNGIDNSTVIDPPSISTSMSFGSPEPNVLDKTLSTIDASGNTVQVAEGFSIGNIDINTEIKALARKTGSDLMSAPKVTVLSGKRANIVVAQELRFPQSYGDIESTVSSGGGTGGSSVAITAGTPQDFGTRNIGVEMAVTPNVESDNTITLELSPRVTEFEGFVEYGGPSIAVSDSTTAVIPAGFYQPVFSTREITTEVNIFDGATVVMGGLTRDEVRAVNDKVPFLGDLPGIGRLFRSDGETRQKRNLLIFVSANLVSPGGSLTNQNYNNLKPNTIYQSPSKAVPSGGNYRNVSIKD